MKDSKKVTKRLSEFNSKDVTNQSPEFISRCYETASEYLYFTVYEYVEDEGERAELEQYILYLNTMVINMGWIEANLEVTKKCIEWAQKYQVGK